MKILFDPAKDAANQAKHGISLAEARWMDWENALIQRDARRDYGEERRQGYARLAGRLYVAVFTLRGAVMRVISLRKANAREREKYETYEKERAQAHG